MQDNTKSLHDQLKELQDRKLSYMTCCDNDNIGDTCSLMPSCVFCDHNIHKKHNFEVADNLKEKINKE